VRRALGPVLAALAAGLLLASSAAPAAAGSSDGSAAGAIARLGAVTASRAEVGSCVTLTGGGFAPSTEVVVRDGHQQVRTVRSGANGAIAAGVCFNGAAQPGRHTLSATGPMRGGGIRAVSSDVYVVGGSAVARAPHHGSAAGHSRLTSIVTLALLVGIPLIVLVVTVTMLLRAAGRLRARRRLARQAAEASVLIDTSAGGARHRRPRPAVVIPLLAGLAVAVLLTVAYGAARLTDMVRQLHHSTTEVARAVHHLQLGESSAAGTQAQRAVDAAAAAHRDETDPVFRLLVRLPGLRQVGNALRVDRQVAETAALSVGRAPADQQARADSGLAQLSALHDTGWGPVDDRADDLRGSLAALGAEARALVSADELRAPMLAEGRRYLLLLQDDRQARATGGLVTTHALLTVGARALSLGSVAPADPSWQAINLTPDFPTVAQTAMELWRHQGGPAVDGVVAVDDVALSRLGADPAAAPADQLRTAFDALRSATKTAVGFDATIVSAGSGGHVQLWSAHPQEQQQLARLSVGGALSGRPAGSFEVVTQSVGGGADAGRLRRDVDDAWRPTLRRDDVGAGLQLMNEAGVDVRLSNAAAVAQPTWLLLYLPRGSGFLNATVDGTAVTLHSDEDQGQTVVSTLVTVPAGGSTLVSVRLVTPTPDGRPPVYIRQPRIVADDVRITRV
jgi:hypothetical protein